MSAAVTRPRLGVLGALAFAACTVQIAGTDRIAIVKGTVTGDGAPLANAAVSAGATTTTTDSTGGYRLNLRDVPDRIVVSVNAQGFMPTKALVEYRGGVFHYRADVALTKPSILAPGSEATLSLGGRMFKVKAPAGVVPTDGGRLEVAVLPPEAGPGAMETTEAVDQRLQTSGLFFLRAVDAAGKPAQLTASGTAPITVTIATDLPRLTDSQDLKVYSLGDDGQWAPAANGGSFSAAELAVTQQGYWNAGRAYKTACVRGRLVAPTKACSGERLRLGGADGVYTQDTTGTLGAFCLDGPQGRTLAMTIGASTTQIAFPAAPGSCRTNPDGCTQLTLGGLDGGAVLVSDADCPISCNKDAGVDDPTTLSGCSK